MVSLKMQELEEDKISKISSGISTAASILGGFAIVIPQIPVLFGKLIKAFGNKAQEGLVNQEASIANTKENVEEANGKLNEDSVKGAEGEVNGGKNDNELLHNSNVPARAKNAGTENTTSMFKSVV